MGTLPAAPNFVDDDAYERSLRDADFWAPYARAALEAAGLPSGGGVRTHFPTTHVAALVNDTYLVKIHYEDWFGEDCFQTELEAYGMLTGRHLPIPELLADGALYPEEGWRWPFLVMTAMPGASMRDRRGDLSAGDLETTADFVGATLSDLHATPIIEGERLSFEFYADMITPRMQRCHHDHETWGSLPFGLRSQIRDYVWNARELVDPEEAAPRLIHGDLHGGNIFVDGPAGSIAPTGIVDFNDAYEGDPYYDLVAVHVKAFGCDKALLQRVLDAYDWGTEGPDWATRMMAFTLLHDYDMVSPVVERFPATRDVATLDELATLLWDLNAPSLV